MAFINCLFNFGWRYLLSRIEESAIWGLELRVSRNEFSSTNRHVKSLFSFSIFKTERVDSVWAAEELGFCRIALNIFPSGVRPSAWDKLQVFFRVPGFVVWLLLFKIWLVESTLILGSASGMISSSTKSILIVPWSALRFFILHRFSENYEKLHYNLIYNLWLKTYDL